MKPAAETARQRGRPRNIRGEEALDAAIGVFWAAGYDGASIDRLVRETGMSRASLYQDHGGKEGLFLAAISRYVETRIGPLVRALGPAGSLEDDLTAFFGEAVALATRDRRTPGCLVSCVLAEVATANDTFRRELDARFTAMEARIAERLSHGVAEPDPGALRARAGLLAAVARGLMLRARSGAGPDELRAVADMAVRTFAGPRA